MRLKQLVDEDFVNYKKPSMFLGACQCDWKCCKEAGSGTEMCQNSALAQSPVKTLSNRSIAKRYLNNPITSAIVIGGLEPMLQIEEIYCLLYELRINQHCNDDVVIYTGYTENEIPAVIHELSQFKNIILKFGRFLPNRPKRFDDVLGVTLASDNQYGKVIS